MGKWIRKGLALSAAVTGAAAMAGTAAWGQTGNVAPGLTIYNQQFAVVRETLPLDLKEGVSRVMFAGATTSLEPDSVILRDPTGKRKLQIVEQNYDANVASLSLLLSKFEGKTIGFQTTEDNKPKIISGKIVRSGAGPVYGGNQFSQYVIQPAGEPIIEVDGKIRFGLPGTPLFPSLGEDALLTPTLSWAISSDKAGPLTAELSYVTRGMTWEADYNLVALDAGDAVDVSGMVTISNQSGKSFENARIKLMAGDVSKIQPPPYGGYGFGGAALSSFAADSVRMIPAVTERTFDEYHLYTLERPTTLRDKETKQVEFVHAAGVKAERIYVYDGVAIDPNAYRGWNYESIRNSREYGTQSNVKVWVMREFKNTKKNGLGIPLPKGRVRFYRRDDKGGALEFVGENNIDHTPQGETLRVYTGDAFDLVGERSQTNYNLDTTARTIDEDFRIIVRNRKKENATIRVAEHLYRGLNWEIRQNSQPFTKKDSRTIEFTVPLRPDEEKTITYRAHYSW